MGLSVVGKYLLKEKLYQSLMFLCFFFLLRNQPKTELGLFDSNLCRLELVCSSYHYCTWQKRHQPSYSHICNKTSQKPHVWSRLLILCHEVVGRVWHTALWNPTRKMKSTPIKRFPLLIWLSVLAPISLWIILFCIFFCTKFTKTFQRRKFFHIVQWRNNLLIGTRFAGSA